MIKIEGNYIYRGGEKVGYVDGHNIRAVDGKHLGYFDDKFIYDEDGHKLAYIEGDHLWPEDNGEKVELVEINEKLVGGVLPEIAKCAVYVLLGD
ncbi:MAG TPA: hypothetical protein VMC43_00165 [Candidatus Paceibacterota bacterium]|nr:hypothetical protein [Candidatus Paceibacterota bacterium]